MPRLVTALLLSLGTVYAARSPADAVVTTVVSVKSVENLFFGTSAADQGWGATLPSQTDSPRKYYTLEYDPTRPFGCPNTTTEHHGKAKSDATILLVQRGDCSYSDKAVYAQQRGASALLITDTWEQVASRAQNKSASSENVALEYDCANGESRYKVPKDSWITTVNDTKCALNSACDSGMCVPISNVSAGHTVSVCCAWDVPDVMGFTITKFVSAEEEIHIPIIRITIKDGEILRSLAKEKVEITFYTRVDGPVDPAQVLLWLLAILTVLYGGYRGAAIERFRAICASHPASMHIPTPEAQIITEVPRLSPSETVSYNNESPAVLDHGSNDETTSETHPEQSSSSSYRSEEEDVLVLHWSHIAVFLIFASSLLLVLFYFDIVIVVIIGFTIASAVSSYEVFWRRVWLSLPALQSHPCPSAKDVDVKYVGIIVQPSLWTRADFVASACAITGAVLWFAYRHKDGAWVFQDIFGICLSLVFLSSIRLPNLKIATTFLIAVFIYDIFMVFISPLIFHESVMIKAATGGAQSETLASSAYCVRYPQDSDCVQEQVPLLLRIPKFLTWQESATMLGLGDIVIPGLLLVFCARYDYATRGQLLGSVKRDLARLNSKREIPADRGENQNEVGALVRVEGEPAPAENTRKAGFQKQGKGLFSISMLGYAGGLLLANVGVVATGTGQPALMYLVPCTLGLVVFVGWKRGILSDLWQGPEELKNKPEAENELGDTPVAATTDYHANREQSVD